MPPKPTLAHLRARANEWNYLHPVGTPVTRYTLVSPLRDGTPTKTRCKAWVMGSHAVMVMVEGVGGAVALESVVPIPKS